MPNKYKYSKDEVAPTSEEEKPVEITPEPPVTPSSVENPNVIISGVDVITRK